MEYVSPIFTPNDDDADDDDDISKSILYVHVLLLLQIHIRNEMRKKYINYILWKNRDFFSTRIDHNDEPKMMI